MEETTSPFVLGLNGHGQWFARFDGEDVGHIDGYGDTPMQALHEMLYSAKRALESMQFELDQKRQSERELRDRLQQLALSPKAEFESWTVVDDLRPGAVFETQGGILAVKTEYRYSAGGGCQCILLASGENAHFSNSATSHDLTPVRELVIETANNPREE